ncbi:MAG: hypothetical protein V6Z86_09425, partial [Hyphomicrobiales bacterium]
MTHALAFDTLKYSKRLVEAGFTQTQAEALAEEQAGLIDERLATKQDLKQLEVALKRDIKQLEAATKQDLKQLEVALKRDIKQLEAATKQD